jgi:hypothetical protein
MSFLSVVNLSKAASMAALSVFESTTRKFFWLSGGGVTCFQSIVLGRGEGWIRGSQAGYVRRCLRGATP